MLPVKGREMEQKSRDGAEPEATEIRPLREAGMKELARLMAESQRAQAAQNAFVRFLLEDYGIELADGWQIDMESGAFVRPIGSGDN